MYFLSVNFFFPSTYTKKAKSKLSREKNMPVIAPMRLCLLYRSPKCDLRNKICIWIFCQTAYLEKKNSIKFGLELFKEYKLRDTFAGKLIHTGWVIQIHFRCCTKHIFNFDLWLLFVLFYDWAFRKFPRDSHYWRPYLKPLSP